MQSWNPEVGGAHGQMTVRQALDSIPEPHMKEVLIMGYDEDGVFFLRSSHMTREWALYLTTRAQHYIMGVKGDDQC